MKVQEAVWDKREETSRREMAKAKRVGAAYGTKQTINNINLSH